MQPFYYGGQAVIEGVLIRGRLNACLAIRRPDGLISTDVFPLKGSRLGIFRRLFLFRGITVLFGTLGLGIRALNRSAMIAALPPDSKELKPDGSVESEGLQKGPIIGSMIAAMFLGISIFFLFPLLGARSLDGIVDSSLITNLLEGLIRLLFLLGYIWGIGHIRDIQRVFQYHGAEHMTIHAHEHGAPLQVDQIAQFPTAHPRCGTAFLLTVALISIIVFALLGRPPIFLAILSRLALIPIIAGISYEFIRFCGTHDQNPVAKFLAIPGLALQRLTTRQPDESQIEVAIAALKQTLNGDSGVLKNWEDLHTDKAAPERS